MVAWGGAPAKHFDCVELWDQLQVVRYVPMARGQFGGGRGGAWEGRGPVCHTILVATDTHWVPPPASCLLLAASSKTPHSKVNQEGSAPAPPSRGKASGKDIIKCHGLPYARGKDTPLRGCPKGPSPPLPWPRLCWEPPVLPLGDEAAGTGTACGQSCPLFFFPLTTRHASRALPRTLVLGPSRGLFGQQRPPASGGGGSSQQAAAGSGRQQQQQPLCTPCFLDSPCPLTSRADVTTIGGVALA